MTQPGRRLESREGGLGGRCLVDRGRGVNVDLVEVSECSVNSVRNSRRESIQPS